MASVPEDQSAVALQAASHSRPLVSHYRWLICAMLFFATTINYIDRQVLGLLAPELQKSIAWNDAQYGYIVTAFQAAYAIGLGLAGGLIDRFGTRIGFAVAITLWSIASIFHSAARTAFGFGLARFALGLGEAGNFPAAIKTTAEWFPQRERAFATGIFNSGSNVGAIIAPLTVPWIAATLGWQWAFVITGSLGLLWLVPWMLIYRRPAEHPHVSEDELALINSDSPDIGGHVPWSAVVLLPQTWAIIVGKTMTDPVWWFFLFWLPKYFSSAYGLKLTGLALPLIIIYIAADFGSIGGGWLSSKLLKAGWSVNAARKTALGVCAACVAPMMAAAFVHNLWVSVALISLAAAAHQGWSANVFTLASDMFPRRAVGSVVGLGGMIGALGGMVTAAVIGNVLQITHGNYVPLLTLAGLAYLLALAAIHALVPQLELARLDGPNHFDRGFEVR